MTDDEHILVSAVRYSLGRQTYIVADCVRWVRKRWPSLGTECRLLIYRDVSAAVNRYTSLSSIDRPVWMDLVTWIAAHMLDDKKVDETIMVSRKALQFVMNYGRFEDEGPWPEGWKSDDMQLAIDTLEKALKR